MENQTSKWSTVWERTLPFLALVGPASWFIAALVRTAGIGTLPGDLFWVSSHEGLIMSYIDLDNIATEQTFQNFIFSDV